MINFNILSHRPRVFLSFTGMTIPEFESIFYKFSSFYDADKQERFDKKEFVVRSIGGGDKETLIENRDKLLFILLYFKCYPLQDLLGFLFGMNQSSANVWIFRLTPILNTTLGYMKVLPKRKIKTMSEFIELFPDALEFFADGVEQPINRPKNYQRQKEYYSGKKKHHSVKNIVITNKKKEIVFLSGTSPGKDHDKKLLDDEEIPYPPGTTGILDLGFVGYSHPNLRLVLPNKKLRKNELTQSQKDQNTVIGSIRVSVEHSIGGMKRNHIVHDIFRNHKSGFSDDVILISAGLHNLRVKLRSK